MTTTSTYNKDRMSRERLPNGVNFNGKHYERVRRARAEQGISKEVEQKGSMFTRKVEQNGLYCAAIKTWLEPHGNLLEHPMIGKKFTHIKEDFKEMVCDSVQVHYWDGGYYYHAILTDENHSSACVIFENINSNHPIICDAVAKFPYLYTLL
jgi:hypothetical protein